MRFVNGDIPNLVGGISQQDPLSRLPNQMSDQINGYNDINEKQGKRPPIQYIGKISDSKLEDAALFVIDRGDDIEFYLAILNTSSGLQVFDLDGTERTVNFTGSTAAYISNIINNTKTDLKLAPILDTTFIINKNETVAMAADTSPASENRGFFFVRQAVNGVNYQIIVIDDIVGGIVATHATHATNAISTNDIASSLKSSMEASLTVYGYTVSVNNYVIQV